MSLSFRFAYSLNKINGFKSCSRWCVYFLIVVLFNDLYIRQKFSSFLSKLHHKYGTNGKVRCDNTTNYICFCTFLELINLSIRSEEHTSELQSRGHLVC